MKIKVKWLVSIFLFVILTSCTIVVETKSYTKEEVYNIAINGINIKKEYKIDPTLKEPYQWMNDEQWEKHSNMVRAKKPDYSFVKSSNNKYYLVEYMDSTNTNLALDDLYQVIELELEIDPDHYYTLYNSLSDENKAFVDSYLQGELYLDLDQSLSYGLRLEVNDSTYVEVTKDYFYLYGNNNLIFISYNNDATRIELTNDNVYDYFDINIGFGRIYGQNDYGEYLNFKFTIKEGHIVHFVNIVFDFNVVVKSDYVAYTFIDRINSNQGGFGSGYKSNSFDYAIPEAYRLYSEKVTFDKKEINVVSGMVYII